MVNVIQDPPDEPLRSEPTTFAVKREAWLTWEKNHLFPGLNAAIAGFNPLISSYEGIRAAIGYAGPWNTLSGPWDISEDGPLSTLRSGKLWMLTEDVANLAAEEPGISTKWRRLSAEEPEQFTGAASLAGQTLVSFGSFAAYRDVEFQFRQVGHSLTSGDFRHLMIQLSADGTNWGTAANITTTTNRMAGGTNRYSGWTRIKSLNEGRVEITTSFGPVGSGVPALSDGSNHFTRLYTSVPVKYARFLIETTGSPTFVNGTIVPFGIGAPYP